MMHPLKLAECSALTPDRVARHPAACEPEKALAVLPCLNNVPTCLGPHSEQASMQPDGPEPSGGLAEHRHDERPLGAQHVA